MLQFAQKNEKNNLLNCYNFLFLKTPDEESFKKILRKIEEHKLNEQTQKSAQTSFNERDRSFSDLQYDGTVFIFSFILF